jgi:hypothetical protein
VETHPHGAARAIWSRLPLRVPARWPLGLTSRAGSAAFERMWCTDSTAPFPTFPCYLVLNHANGNLDRARVIVTTRMGPVANGINRTEVVFAEGFIENFWNLISHITIYY